MTLSSYDWNIIEKLVLILKPCEEVTREMSGEKYVTGSAVIPITIALKSALVVFDLDGAEPLPNEVEMARQDILSGLSSRFSSLENSPQLACSSIQGTNYILKMRTQQSQQRNTS